MWKTTTVRSISDLSPEHQTSEISLKTSDLMLKQQKWQHWSKLFFNSVLTETSCVLQLFPG